MPTVPGDRASDSAGATRNALAAGAQRAATLEPERPIKRGLDHGPSPVAEVALAFRLHDVTVISHLALRRAKATAANEVRELEEMLDEFTARQRSTVADLRLAGYVDLPEFPW